MKSGVPVIYGGLSAEICAMEKLVHTGPILPVDLLLVALTLPDAPDLYEAADVATLPGWNVLPPNDASVKFATAFLRSGRALGLIVPSAVMPEARNVILNPLHRRFPEVEFALKRPFSFDLRLRPG